MDVTTSENLLSPLEKWSEHHGDASDSDTFRARMAVLRVQHPASDAKPVAHPRMLNCGSVIGRYVVHTVLGHGGMGVVYAAYDPELDRKVALKLLSPRIAGGLDELGKSQFLREAQALARLAHPNVVAIHDVGMHDEHVWIAMEFVAGKTLNAWAKGHPRSWPDILQVLISVARGVAAAHAAGLVHRDLKPDNVMIDDRGRVRVMDFGLAHGRAPTSDESATLPPGGSRPDVAALTLRLTRAGALNGTPAYMAPEQWQGMEASTAADQFGWSVMAWELLFGERPFTGENMADLEDNIVSGRRRRPPRSRSVPGWLRRTVERGLASEPTSRWPTMTALLAALEGGRTGARVRTAALALATLATLVASAAGYRRVVESRQIAACNAEGASITEAWNPEVRTKLSDAFLASGVEYAVVTAEKVLTRIDARAAAWEAARTAACLDTRVRGTADEDLLDRSVWCLEDRRIELEALIAELMQIDSTWMSHAVTATSLLSELDSCRDAHRLAKLPALPQERASVQVARRSLARAVALRAAGRYSEAIEAFKEAKVVVEEIGWAPLTVTAHWRHGDLLERLGKYAEAEEALEGAYFQALEVGVLDVAAQAAVRLVEVVGVDQNRFLDGIRWSRHANVQLVALGEDENSNLHLNLLRSLGGIHTRSDELETALTFHERELAMAEELYGPDDVTVGIALGMIAGVYHHMGMFERAKTLREREIAIARQTLGPDHPDLASTLGNLASVHLRMGEYEKAAALLEQARSLAERVLGPDHREVATILQNLAIARRNMGEYEDARALYERALTILRRSNGANDVGLATVLTNLANVYLLTGAYQAAKDQFIEALALQEKALGSDHQNVAITLDGLGICFYRMGDLEEARINHERALRIYTAALGPEHLYVTVPLTNLARVALAQHRPETAVQLAERAVQIRSSTTAPADWLAGSRFVLAQGLWDAPVGRGRDRGRALLLARQARDVLRETKGKNKELADVDAFLASTEHRRDMNDRSSQ